MTQKVFVGLSGGVDSAVSAALLKERGYDVVGVFIKIWQPEFLECNWREERLDAMRVAAILDIPFREVDLSAEYKKEVVDDMVRDYARGITPNPDVLCNRHIKFGAFVAWATEEGADHIATGHYAQIRQREGDFELLRGRDAEKDQSYFLHTLDQKQLGRALFPVGALLKKDVREKARRLGLPQAEKPDSQGLCFVGEVSMADFLSRFIPLVPGPVLLNGSAIGEHQGAALYTVGQRHGFLTHRAPLPGPYYITRIDVSTNTLFVSLKRSDAARSSVSLERIHWISHERTLPLKACAQARYREQPVVTTLSKTPKGILATFEEPHIISPGQSLVLYDAEVCLGGGIIAKSRL
ncbi:MAG: tRNA 2-thiouridine(34) synthase MnmA [Patescibacteria group bacterium]